MKKYRVVCLHKDGTPKYLRYYTVTNGKREWKGASSQEYCQRLADRINRMIDNAKKTA